MKRAGALSVEVNWAALGHEWISSLISDVSIAELGIPLHVFANICSES